MRILNCGFEVDVLSSSRNPKSEIRNRNNA